MGENVRMLDQEKWHRGVSSYVMSY